MRPDLVQVYVDGLPVAIVEYRLDPFRMRQTAEQRAVLGQRWVLKKRHAFARYARRQIRQGEKVRQ